MDAMTPDDLRRLMARKLHPSTLAKVRRREVVHRIRLRTHLAHGIN